MSKPEVIMTDWELYIYDNRYQLTGTAINHPRLGRWTYVSYTTTMVSHRFEKDVLWYETENTMYICPLKYMTTKPYLSVVSEYKDKLMQQADNSDSELDKIIAASARIACEKELDEAFTDKIIRLQTEGQTEIKELRNQENNKLIEVAKQYEDCVYLEVTNIECGDTLAYHISGASGVIYPMLHSGMFQDSVLYMKYPNDKDSEGDFGVDFRYFPRWGGIETYSWSDNIKCAVIKNCLEETISFNQTILAPGETKVVTPEGHCQGLLSPDCYNGKSCLD